MIAEAVDILEEKYLCFLLDRLENNTIIGMKLMRYAFSLSLSSLPLLYLLPIFRDHNGPVCIASPAGGMDIEEVAKSTPEKVKTVPIDIFEGLSLNTAKDVAKFLEFKGAAVDQVNSYYVHSF
jgi:succinyl-CoA synthetase beta subunit